jgi:hypothetical protein
MNMLEKIGGKRLLNELIHIFREPKTESAVKRMAMLGCCHLSIRPSNCPRQHPGAAANFGTYFMVPLAVP